jgi:hypothetical protein
MNALITDTKLYLHQKTRSKGCSLVDASDEGWGACAYPMPGIYEGNLNEEGRMRINEAGL